MRESSFHYLHRPQVREDASIDEYNLAVLCACRGGLVFQLGCKEEGSLAWRLLGREREFSWNILRPTVEIVRGTALSEQEAIQAARNAIYHNPQVHMWLISFRRPNRLSRIFCNNRWYDNLCVAYRKA